MIIDCVISALTSSNPSFTEQLAPGRYVRAPAYQAIEHASVENATADLSSDPAPKRKRRTHVSNQAQLDEPLVVPRDMRQAFFVLASLVNRRSVQQLAVMTRPEIEVLLERLEQAWAEIDKE